MTRRMRSPSLSDDSSGVERAIRTDRRSWLSAERISRRLIWLALALIAIAIMLPLLLTVNVSLKTPKQYSHSSVGITSSPTLSNYVQVWHYAGMPRSLFNSLLTSGGAVIVLWVVAGFAAYAFAFLRFKGRGALFIGILATVMLPIQTILYPFFVQMIHLHLANEYYGLILAFTVFGLPLITFQFAAYFKTLPFEVIEAAKIDGASVVRIWMRVVMPMSKPVVATTGVIILVSTWNDLLLPLLVMSSSSREPLVTSLAILFDQQFVYDTPLLAASALMGMIPIVIAYLLAQRQLVQGITAGATR